ncbi:hypothetical protein [Nocardiopsis quinghaiensis]|uniref:hypothetical protein n=1 Tax=Nocardiopsis quinghaiensis TaxID=464995 RepID=UPI0012388E81|nr:hypothetical protein [Nocardiopsis quinghaiensis]
MRLSALGRRASGHGRSRAEIGSPPGPGRRRCFLGARGALAMTGLFWGVARLAAVRRDRVRD